MKTYMMYELKKMTKSELIKANQDLSKTKLLKKDLAKLSKETLVKKYIKERNIQLLFS